MSVIVLYVPDASVRALGKNGGLGRVILEGVPELDFLPPPWWEHSHTVKLGPMPAQSVSVHSEEARATEEMTCRAALGNRFGVSVKGSPLPREAFD